MRRCFPLQPRWQTCRNGEIRNLWGSFFLNPARSGPFNSALFFFGPFRRWFPCGSLLTYWCCSSSADAGRSRPAPPRREPFEAATGNTGSRATRRRTRTRTAPLPPSSWSPDTCLRTVSMFCVCIGVIFTHLEIKQSVRNRNWFTGPSEPRPAPCWQTAATHTRTRCETDSYRFCGLFWPSLHCL